MASYGHRISVAPPWGLCIQQILSKGWVFILNLLLGWTVIGWIVALTWTAARPQSLCRFVFQNVPAFFRRLELRLLIQPNPGLKCPTLAELSQGLNKKGAPRELSHVNGKGPNHIWSLKTGVT